MAKCVLFAVLIFVLASLASSLPEPYPYKSTTTPALYIEHHKREAQPEPYHHKPRTTTTTTPAPNKKYHKREALQQPNPYKPRAADTTAPAPYKRYKRSVSHWDNPRWCPSSKPRHQDSCEFKPNLLECKYLNYASFSYDQCKCLNSSLYGVELKWRCYY